MLRIFLTSVFVLVSTIAPIITVAGEFAVSPMVINVKGEKNVKVPFEFTIKAKKGGSVKLSVFDLEQLETGHMGFVEGDKEIKESKANWIELKEDRFNIKTDEYVVANGFLRLPHKAKGKHLAAIMVEELKEDKDKKGINVNVRYAVVLKIDSQTNTKRARIKTEFKQLTQQKTEEGWMFEAWFQNLSTIEGVLQNEIQIRNGKRKLVGKVAMKTLSAWQRGEDGSVVYPGSMVKVFGTLKEPLVEGDYTVRVRNKFNGRNQPVFRDNIEIKTVEESTTEESNNDDTQAEIAQVSTVQSPDQATAEGSVN